MSPDDPDTLRAPERAIYEPPTLDPEQYRASLAEFKMTKEQQDELLAVLWNIMRTFVELGWGLDSVNSIFSEMAQNAVLDSENTLEQNHPTRERKRGEP
ncbi:hypothetical protein [uncultured Abyssibacter sp.]|uniref:hypothetical protein n=1 Tax=uncultured Abyssibacter sp. TaxID=2320202 RepID=UPI0032B23270